MRGFAWVIFALCALAVPSRADEILFEEGFEAGFAGSGWVASEGAWILDGTHVLTGATALRLTDPADFDACGDETPVSSRAAFVAECPALELATFGETRALGPYGCHPGDYANFIFHNRRDATHLPPAPTLHHTLVRCALHLTSVIW